MSHIQVLPGAKFSRLVIAGFPLICGGSATPHPGPLNRSNRVVYALAVSAPCLYSLVRGAIMEVVFLPPVGAEDVDPTRPAGASGKNETRQGTDAASTCTLWCAVAMGALVQGQPTERVR